MVVNASPDMCDFDETLQALRFGEITKSTMIHQQQPILSSITNQDMNNKTSRRVIYDKHGRAVFIDFPIIESPSITNVGTSSLPSRTAQATTPDKLPNNMQEEYDQLQREIMELKHKYDAQEIEIRDKLSIEMESHLTEMQRKYDERINRIMQQQEERRSSARKSIKSSSAPDMKVTMEDLKDLVDQVDECEAEMKRMKDHWENEKNDMEERVS